MHYSTLLPSLLITLICSKMRRLSKKNSSFEDSGQDLCYVDVVCDQQCADEQFKVEHNEEVVVEEEHDVEEEEEEVVEVMDEVVVEEKPVVEEEEVYYYEEEVPEEEEAIQEEPDQWHSYPRPVSPSRKGGRGKAKRLVERECQADLPPPDHSYRSPRPKSAHDVVHLVDVGTQVSENEFMLIEEVLEEIETERVSVGC